LQKQVTHFKFWTLIAIIAGYTSVMLVMLMGQSSFYSMSVDGLLPKFLVIYMLQHLIKQIFFYGIR
jgi:amino acid transporter